MKLDVEVNFDFGKLANELDKLLDDYAQRVTATSAERAKEAIDSGKFRSLKQSTREIREKGQSPASGRTATNSFKPLVHTGRLRNSIKGTKGGVEMLSYGQYHLKGDKTPMSKFAKKFNMVGTDRPARNFLASGLKLASKDTTKLTRNLIKSMKKSMHLSTPLVLKG